MPLLCTVNEPEVHDLILEFWEQAEERGPHDLVTPVFEHGQWWVTCDCGAQWSVNDCTPGGFDFEEVSTGDEDYHE